MKGVELEKNGKVFEAMRMYRRAVHLDRNIEFKMYENLKAIQSLNKHTQPVDNHNIETLSENHASEDLSSIDLVARFQASIANGNGNLISKGNADGVICTDEGLHFSNLPTEIILYILRWIVTKNLDLRSLEQCSMVCKGLYICARDTEIWRLACLKYEHNRT